MANLTRQVRISLRFVPDPDRSSPAGFLFFPSFRLVERGGDSPTTRTGTRWDYRQRV
ncbi:hypothetical protein V0288_08370 [Pannus brasiliensis CCIBt3594]|uniref:Uncharacterized protein n=1 Tax=Pannus brasiliensis CCIBt3594 TaxID=1427578 RepID=A0AAW9QH66_9CHRO